MSVFHKAFGYYHMKEGYQNRKNRFVVCSIFQSDVDLKFQLLARGLAICSLLDMPCKKIGRAIAEGRADKILERKDARVWGQVIRCEAWEILENLEIGLPAPIGAEVFKEHLIPNTLLPHEARELAWLNRHQVKAELG